MKYYSKMETATNFKALKTPLLLALGALVVFTGAYCVIFPGNNPLTFLRSKLSKATPPKDEATGLIGGTIESSRWPGSTEPEANDPNHGYI